MLPGEQALAYVARLAQAKARAGITLSPGSGLVLGADTTVTCEGRIMGKPVDREDALDMMAQLSGRWHDVLSAVSVTDGQRTESALSQTRVRFRELSAEEALAYWETGEPADKAGGYAIQGLAALFVEAIEGSYTGVVGLPLFETGKLLKAFGLDPFEKSRE